MATINSDDSGSSLDKARREIRILNIQPSPESDTTIECSLKTISLDNDHEYIALSYVWGDSAITSEIRVNGIPMAVTTNLVAFLRQLRAHRSGEKSSPVKDLPPWIWVDAICINQHDIPERNSQVPLMRDIYRKAMKVISWLGPEADRSSQALCTLRTIAQEITQLPPEGDRFDWLQWYPDLLKDGQEPNPWKDINVLWKRNYWKRLWILQEVILAKEILIMCGEEVILWKDIRTVNKWVKSIERTTQRPSFANPDWWRSLAIHSIFKPEPVERVEVFRIPWNRANEERTPEVMIIGFRILSGHRDIQATDPRDFVYGVLGITTVNIIPDYSKSIREVYTEAALENLRLYGLTLALNDARKDGNKFSLPSWVPDWSNMQRQLNRRKYFADAKGPNPDHSAFCIDSSQPNILSVKGVRICHVLELQRELSSDPEASRPARAWRLSQDIAERYRKRLYPTGIPPLQAILRLFFDDRDEANENGQLEIPSEKFFKLAAAFLGFSVAQYGFSQGPRWDRITDELPKIGLATDERFSETFAEQFLGPGTKLPPWTSAEQAVQFDFDSYFMVLSGIGQIFIENQFFYTDDWYFGYGPKDIQPLDLVCAVKGCDFPIILREADEGFIFIGTSIVQGLIDEGVLKELINGATSFEQFDLY